MTEPPQWLIQSISVTNSWLNTHGSFQRSLVALQNIPPIITKLHSSLVSYLNSTDIHRAAVLHEILSTIFTTDEHNSIFLQYNTSFLWNWCQNLTTFPPLPNPHKRVTMLSFANQKFFTDVEQLLMLVSREFYLWTCQSGCPSLNALRDFWQKQQNITPIIIVDPQDVVTQSQTTNQTQETDRLAMNLPIDSSGQLDNMTMQNILKSNGAENMDNENNQQRSQFISTTMSDINDIDDEDEYNSSEWVDVTNTTNYQILQDVPPEVNIIDHSMINVDDYDARDNDTDTFNLSEMMQFVGKDITSLFQDEIIEAKKNLSLNNTNTSNNNINTFDDDDTSGEFADLCAENPFVELYYQYLLRQLKHSLLFSIPTNNINQSTGFDHHSTNQEYDSNGPIASVGQILTQLDEEDKLSLLEQFPFWLLPHYDTLTTPLTTTLLPDDIGIWYDIHGDDEGNDWSSTRSLQPYNQQQHHHQQQPQQHQEDDGLLLQHKVGKVLFQSQQLAHWYELSMSQCMKYVSKQFVHKDVHSVELCLSNQTVDDGANITTMNNNNHNNNNIPSNDNNDNNDNSTNNTNTNDDDDNNNNNNNKNKDTNTSIRTSPHSFTNMQFDEYITMLRNGHDFSQFLHHNDIYNINHERSPKDNVDDVKNGINGQVLPFLDTKLLYFLKTKFKFDKNLENDTKNTNKIDSEQNILIPHSTHLSYNAYKMVFQSLLYTSRKLKHELTQFKSNNIGSKQGQTTKKTMYNPFDLLNQGNDQPINENNPNQNDTDKVEQIKPHDPGSIEALILANDSDSMSDSDNDNNIANSKSDTATKTTTPTPVAQATTTTAPTTLNLEQHISDFFNHQIFQHFKGFELNSKEYLRVGMMVKTSNNDKDVDNSDDKSQHDNNNNNNDNDNNNDDNPNSALFDDEDMGGLIVEDDDTNNVYIDTDDIEKIGHKVDNNQGDTKFDPNSFPPGTDSVQNEQYITALDTYKGVNLFQNAQNQTQCSSTLLLSVLSSLLLFKQQNHQKYINEYSNVTLEQIISNKMQDIPLLEPHFGLFYLYSRILSCPNYTHTTTHRSTTNNNTITTTQGKKLSHLKFNMTTNESLPLIISHLLTCKSCSDKPNMTLYRFHSFIPPIHITGQFVFKLHSLYLDYLYSTNINENERNQLQKSNQCLGRLTLSQNDEKDNSSSFQLRRFESTKFSLQQITTYLVQITSTYYIRDLLRSYILQDFIPHDDDDDDDVGEMAFHDDDGTTNYVVDDEEQDINHLQHHNKGINNNTSTDEAFENLELITEEDDVMLISSRKDNKTKITISPVHVHFALIYLYQHPCRILDVLDCIGDMIRTHHIHTSTATTTTNNNQTNTNISEIEPTNSILTRPTSLSLPTAPFARYCPSIIKYICGPRQLSLIMPLFDMGCIDVSHNNNNGQDGHSTTTLIDSPISTSLFHYALSCTLNHHSSKASLPSQTTNPLELSSLTWVNIPHHYYNHILSLINMFNPLNTQNTIILPLLTHVMSLSQLESSQILIILAYTISNEIQTFFQHLYSNSTSLLSKNDENVIDKVDQNEDSDGGVNNDGEEEDTIFTSKVCFLSPIALIWVLTLYQTHDTTITIEEQAVYYNLLQQLESYLLHHQKLMTDITILTSAFYSLNHFSTTHITLPSDEFIPFVIENDSGSSSIGDVNQDNSNDDDGMGEEGMTNEEKQFLLQETNHLNDIAFLFHETVRLQDTILSSSWTNHNSIIDESDNKNNTNSPRCYHPTIQSITKESFSYMQHIVMTDLALVEIIIQMIKSKFRIGFKK